MGKPKTPQEAEADVELFRNWNDPDWKEPELPDAGIGLFSDLEEHDAPELPEAGIGIFDHWFED